MEKVLRIHMGRLRIHMGRFKVEEAFRRQKPFLGARPFCHQISRMGEVHIPITVLASQRVTGIRNRLKAHRINYSWDRIRAILSTQMSSKLYAITLDRRIVSRRPENDMDRNMARIMSALGLSTVSMDGWIVYEYNPDPPGSITRACYRPLGCSSRARRSPPRRPGLRSPCPVRLKSTHGASAAPSVPLGA
jgi:hypothetical protein